MNENFRDLRLRSGFSQVQLAESAGVRQATISALENGQTQPHFSTIQAIAKVLKIDPAELQSVIRPVSSSAEMMDQFVGDWPFLTGLDLDLRKGLITSLVAEWTHSSTALEGNTITLGETLFVLTEGLTVSGKTLREHQELHGHSAALGLMISWTGAGRSVGISELHGLHRAIQTGVAIDSLAPVGRWKVEPNGTTAITTSGQPCWHDYAHPRHVPFLTKDFLTILNRLPKSLQKFSFPDSSLGSGSGDLISLYTAIHLGFVAIHPYADGNGRMARLLANLPLLAAGWPPLLVDASKRQRYLALLGDYSLSRGQPQPGEELVFENSERLAVEDFFNDCWKNSLQLVGDFHEKQVARA